MSPFSAFRVLREGLLPAVSELARQPGVAGVLSALWLLPSVLKPSLKALEKDERLRERHVCVALPLALRLVAVFVASDSICQRLRPKSGPSLAQFSLAGEPLAWIDFSQEKAISQGGASPRKPDVTVTFSSVAVAAKLMTNDLDSFAAINAGDLSISGYLPLADKLDQMLARIKHLV